MSQNEKLIEKEDERFIETSSFAGLGEEENKNEEKKDSEESKDDQGAAIIASISYSCIKESTK